jgi:hypothetical protein
VGPVFKSAVGVADLRLGVDGGVAFIFFLPGGDGGEAGVFFIGPLGNVKLELTCKVFLCVLPA